MSTMNYVFEKENFATAPMCSNTLTLSADSAKALDTVSKLIIDAHGQVDFGILIPIPEGVGNAITYMRDNRDELYPVFNTANPDRIGAQTIETLLSPEWADNELVKQAKYLDSEVLNKEETVEENLDRLLYNPGTASYRSVNKEKAQRVLIVYTSKVCADLNALIVNDHEQWCLETFGFKTWEEWHNQNWGTLWRPEGVEFTEAETDTTVTRVYQFETPLTPPYQWFVFIAKTARENNVRMSLEAIYDCTLVSNAQGIVVSETGNIRIIPKVAYVV